MPQNKLTPEQRKANDDACKARYRKTERFKELNAINQRNHYKKNRDAILAKRRERYRLNKLKKLKDEAGS
jgi:5'-3' exonuclease